MEASFIAAEARRLGVPQLADAVGKYGVSFFEDGLVPAERIIGIFEARLRRAYARKDDQVARLVQDLLFVFRSAISRELNVIHVVAGDMDAILYAEADGKKVLAVVDYSAAAGQ